MISFDFIASRSLALCYFFLLSVSFITEADPQPGVE